MAKRVMMVFMLLLSLSLLLFAVSCTSNENAAQEQDVAEESAEELPPAVPELPEEIVEENAESVEDAQVVEEVTIEDVEGNVDDGTVEEPIEASGNVHVVEIKGTDYIPDQLTIKKGDTVIWKNERYDENPEKAIVQGAQWCNYVKSGVFMPGEQFEWIFEQTGKCTVVEAIIVNQVMKITIEE